MKVFFGGAHSPWQRDLNKSINGLLPQYLPMSTDSSTFTPEELDAIAWMLNAGQRKLMDFKYPAQLLTANDFCFRQHQATLFALGH